MRIYISEGGKNMSLKIKLKRLLFIFPSILFTFFTFACEQNPTLESNNNSSFQTVDTMYCMVDLRGEVIYPGIYKIESGTMLNDLLDLAGGVTKNADISNINLVTTIENNVKIIIPKINENSGEIVAYINLNTCTKEELMTVPNIGLAKAEAIIKYRTEKGSFTSVEELKNINGIGDAIFEKIKVYFTV